MNFVTYNKINRKKKLPVQNEKITDPDTGEQKYTGSAPAGHHNNGCCHCCVLAYLDIFVPEVLGCCRLEAYYLRGSQGSEIRGTAC